MITKKLIILGFLLLLIVGCASRGEIETIQNQLNYLERSSTQMQDRIVVLDSLYRDAIEKNLTYQADLKVLLTDLRDQNYIIDGRLTDMEARIAEILNRIDNTSSWTQPTTTTQQSDSSGDTTTTTTTSLPQIDPNKLFDNAFTDLRTGNYDLAIMQFEEYLNLFESSTRANEAQYWLAECYYGKKDFEKAIPQFEKVEKNYPKSDKLVSALYKTARSFEELGKKKSAKALFERIVKEHPNAFEAKSAAEKLKEL